MYRFRRKEGPRRPTVGAGSTRGGSSPLARSPEAFPCRTGRPSFRPYGSSNLLGTQRSASTLLRYITNGRATGDQLLGWYPSILPSVVATRDEQTDGRTDLRAQLGGSVSNLIQGAPDRPTDRPSEASKLEV